MGQAMNCTKHACPARIRREWITDHVHERCTASKLRCSLCTRYGGMILDNDRFCFEHAMLRLDAQQPKKRSLWERVKAWARA
jgi:hypothetical protein